MRGLPHALIRFYSLAPKFGSDWPGALHRVIRVGLPHVLIRFYSPALNYGSDRPGVLPRA